MEIYAELLAKALRLRNVTVIEPLREPPQRLGDLFGLEQLLVDHPVDKFGADHICKLADAIQTRARSVRFHVLFCPPVGKGVVAAKSIAAGNVHARILDCESFDPNYNYETIRRMDVLFYVVESAIAIAVRTSDETIAA